MSEFTADTFNKKASSYEDKWNSYLKHTHREFLHRIETANSDVILDLSCGTGLLAEEMIQQNFSFKKLILNDPSEEMLAIARERLPDNGTISFTNRHVQEMEYEENSFDEILCLNAFHFYSGQHAIIENIYRMLKPGGKFYVLDWNRSGFFRIINMIIRLSAPERINSRSLNELEQMLRQCKFTINASNTWNWRYWKFLFVEAGKEN